MPSQQKPRAASPHRLIPPSPPVRMNDCTFVLIVEPSRKQNANGAKWEGAGARSAWRPGCLAGKDPTSGPSSTARGGLLLKYSNQLYPPPLKKAPWPPRPGAKSALIPLLWKPLALILSVAQASCWHSYTRSPVLFKPLFRYSVHSAEALSN